ncbi:hypothetical protein CYMTET_56847 [Cymbomonas tetramitiformis]|uniref:Uncharacterized protein n=1 Tax=Cymbomonas tetramitiformis TaxID=36881 RepID=A0AAE0ELF4_9CHLO|nr:hypothetical protein CYMTET_56847 [Cymbomonas tetramitiformis]
MRFLRRRTPAAGAQARRLSGLCQPVLNLAVPAARLRLQECYWKRGWGAKVKRTHECRRDLNVETSADSVLVERMADLKLSELHTGTSLMAWGDALNLKKEARSFWGDVLNLEKEARSFWGDELH